VALPDDQSEVLDGEPALALDVVAALPPGLPVELTAELAELLEDAERYAAAAQSINTSRAYASDWTQFTTWCDRYTVESLPASAAVVGLYLTSMAKRGLSVSTIRRRAAAIARTHRQAGLLPATSDPRVQTVLEGIARVHGAAAKKKTALLRDPLLELIERIDLTDTAGVRDRALLLLGFAVGLRRSELVALTVEDLSPSPDGIRIRIGRSKTDQTGRGQELLVVYAEPPRPCPVRAVRAWLDIAAITTGPIFRRVTRTGAVSAPLSPQSVALIIKKRARAAELGPREFAGHSLRSGYATQAARDGPHATQIAATTRHQDQRVLAGYIRAGRGKDDVAHVI
jgi:site-specific recombinase XerD